MCYWEGLDLREPLDDNSVCVVCARLISGASVKRVG